MYDIHSHLLFNIDDGSKSIDNSVKILSDLALYGYKGVILTPHYISDSIFSSPKKNNLLLLQELKEKLKEENINIDLYLGNEIYINYDILKLLKKNIISSLNDSSYLLIELPMSGEFEGYIDVFSDLINNGYKVILAHPERYHSFQNDFNKIYELEKIGVIFQSNIDSIIGGYGKKAKKMMRKLLKEHKISILATDIHHGKRDYKNWDKAKRKALKYLTIDEYNKLINDNPKKIINNINL